MLKNNLPFLNWLPLAKKTWKDDLIAGLTGTIIVIPQEAITSSWWRPSSKACAGSLNNPDDSS